MQDSVMVRAYSVDWLLHLHYKVFSHDPQTKKWYTVPRFFTFHSMGYDRVINNILS